MDLEVGKAYRTLQRAGIIMSPISPQMNLKEFQTSYTELLRLWIEHHGIHCGLLLLTNVRYGSYGGVSETTLLKAAVPYLEKLFESENQVPATSLRVRLLHHLGNRSVRADPANPLSSMFGDFMSNYSPTGLWTEFFEDAGIAAPGEPLIEPNERLKNVKKEEKAAFLLCVDQNELEDARPTAAGGIFGYRDEAPDEAAKTKARKEKAAETAAKRKAAVEAKEKRLLEKLKAKYEED